MATLFLSYSHKDEKWRVELETHLSMLKRQGILDVWHDRRIVAGEEFAQAISENLEAADIILLLVSSDFLASDYCHNIEMQRAMERHENKEARVFPVILRPCDWHGTSFGKLLAMPTDGKPVSKFPDKDDAFLEVVQAIKRLVGELKPSIEDKPLATQPRSPFKAQTLDAPRSSNLRIRKTFSDQERDTFVDESFEYIANFFENSLNELSARNPEVQNRFKRIDANHFTAIVYTSGKVATQCKIWLGERRSFGGTIAYSYNASGHDNSLNESMSIVDDGYALFLQPMGMAMLGRGGNDKKMLSPQGAAEYFWEMFIQRLQQ